jgi:putative sigma-54 modulation protein
MKLLIQGNNITITEAIHDYVKQKVEKAVKHFQHRTTKIDVHLSVAKKGRISDKHKAEVSVHANGTIIHVREETADLYASIDLVADKVSRQLRKHKEKYLYSKTHVPLKTGEMLAREILEENLAENFEDELVSV